MVAVIASTNKDRPKMEWAGVDIGVKMFVGLENACPTTFDTSYPANAGLRPFWCIRFATVQGRKNVRKDRGQVVARVYRPWVDVRCRSAVTQLQQQSRRDRHSEPTELSERFR